MHLLVCLPYHPLHTHRTALGLPFPPSTTTILPSPLCSLWTECPLWTGVFLRWVCLWVGAVEEADTETYGCIKSLHAMRIYAFVFMCVKV